MPPRKKTKPNTIGICKFQHLAPIVDNDTAEFTLEEDTYIETLRKRHFDVGLKGLEKEEIRCLFPDVFASKPGGIESVTKPVAEEMVKKWQSAGATNGALSDHCFAVATLIKGLVQSKVNEIDEKIQSESKAIKVQVQKVKEDLKKEKQRHKLDEDSKKVIMFQDQDTEFSDEILNDQHKLKKEFVEILSPYSDGRQLQDKHINFIRPLQNSRFKLFMRSQSWRDDIVAEATLAKDFRIKRGKTHDESVIAHNIYLANTAVHYFNSTSDGAKYAVTVKNDGEFSRVKPYVLKYFDADAPEVAEVVKLKKENKFVPFVAAKPDGLDAFLA